MRTFYDGNKCCTVYTCPHCNYTYHEYFDDRKYTETQEEPFIVLDEKLLYFKPLDYEADQAKRLYHYACPSCGILQIDTSDV